MASIKRVNSVLQTVSFKPPELLDLAKARAEERGQGISEYLRDLVRRDLESSGGDATSIAQQMEIRDIFGQKAEGQIVDALNKMSEEIQALKEMANPENKALNAKHAEARDLVAKKVGVKKKKRA